jgi:NDP-sugar pyrophosphorylase family protein
MRLCGRRAGRDAANEVVRECAKPRALAFSGIHVISPRIFEKMTEDGAFSIISTYLRLAAQGENIFGFRADEYYWRDLGRSENVARAEQDLKDKIFS